MSGFSDYAENEIVDHALGTGAAWAQPTASAIQLCIADPGDNWDGATGAAANATIKAVTWNAAAGGVATNSADIDWTTGEVTTTEVYSHYVLWDGTTGFGTDNQIGSGSLSGGSVTANNAFKIAAGQLSFTLT